MPWYWPQGNQQPLPNEVSIFLLLQTIFYCSYLEWNQAVITPNSSTALCNTQGWQPSFTRYLVFHLAPVFGLMLWPVGKICSALWGFLHLLANLPWLKQNSTLPLQCGTGAEQALSILSSTGDLGCQQKHPGHKITNFCCVYGESTMLGIALTTYRHKAPMRMLLSVGSNWLQINNCIISLPSQGSVAHLK